MSGWLLPPAALLDLAQELADITTADAVDVPGNGGAAPVPAAAALASMLRQRFSIEVTADELAGLDPASVLALVHERMG